MKIVAVVPMKLNSKRLPRKNIKSFTNGQPLCTYILATLKKISMISEVYVYCSNPDIKEFLLEGVQYLQRPVSMDEDTTQMNEILHKFAETVSADVYVLAHATAPFISTSSIEKGLNMVLEEGYDSAFAVKRMQDFFWKDNRPFNYDPADIPRTQDLEPFYVETSGFYVYTRNVIRLGRRIGNRPYMVEVGEIEGIDIDEREDFLMADAVYNYYLQFGNEETIL